MHFSAQQTEGSFFFLGQRKERQHWLTGFEANSKRQVCFGGSRGLVGALKCQKRKTACGISEGQCCWLQMFLQIIWVFVFFCNFRRKSPTYCLNVTNESILRVEGGDNEALAQVSFARLCASLIYPDGEEKNCCHHFDERCRVKLFKKIVDINWFHVTTNSQRYNIQKSCEALKFALFVYLFGEIVMM